MRVVLDTNLVISGLLWHGPPRELIELARRGTIELITSAVLLAELDDVLNREKLAARLNAAGATATDLLSGYAALAEVVRPANIAPVIVADPDDDEVLACALAARADAIGSGDSHLLGLGEYEGIPILSASDLIQRVQSASKAGRE